MKGIVLIAVLILFNLVSFGQAQKSIPRNFIGIFGGIECNTNSGLAGISYERIMMRKDKLALGLRGAYVFNYNYGNIVILFSSYEGTASLGMLMPTLHYSTSKTKTGNDGFFVQMGLGIAFRNTVYNEMKNTEAAVCMEPAFGWQSRLNNKLTLTWTNSVLFGGHGGIISSGFSLGF